MVLHSASVTTVPDAGIAEPVSMQKLSVLPEAGKIRRVPPEMLVLLVLNT